MRKAEMQPPSQALAHLTGREYEEGLLNYLRELFRFLTDDYGFVETPPIASRELRLKNASTLIVIKNEWEGPWIAFDRASEPKNREYGSLPLFVIMTIRNSEFAVSHREPMIDKFVRYAKAIPECAEDVLRGDFSIEPEVLRQIDKRREEKIEWERMLHLRPLIAQADEAFRKKDYKTVVDCLAPVQSDLPAAQTAKLAYAQRKVAGED